VPPADQAAIGGLGKLRLRRGCSPE
jgi:hypothetical protein